MYQWDLNQRIILTNIKAGTEVHFSDEHNTFDDCPITITYENDGNIYANIPNIFLQKNGIITVYIYVKEENEAYTEHKTEILVLRRPKPSDYVYTETEVKTWEQLNKRIDAISLERNAINKVESLPTENISVNYYYRTSDGVYWFDGKWHKVVDEETLKSFVPEIENADYDENNPESKAYIKNRPFYETDKVEISGKIEGSYGTIDPDVSVWQASNEPLTREQLFNSISPFNVEIKHYGNTTEDLISLETYILDESKIVKESDGYIIVGIQHTVPSDDYSSNSRTATINIFVIYDYTKFPPDYSYFGWTPNQNGIYFTDNHGYLRACVERLVSGGIKKLDNKFLDLPNNEDFQVVESIAKGANAAESFDDYKSMIAHLNDAPNDEYYKGQNINVVTMGVPDLWVKDIVVNDIIYDHSAVVGGLAGDARFVKELDTIGYVQVGYYQLARLETQKVYLQDYVKNTDYATKDKAGLIRPGIKSMLMVDDKLMIVGADKRMIDSKGTAEYFLTPSMLDYIVKLGLTTNTISLEAEEKESAHKWLDIPIHSTEAVTYSHNTSNNDSFINHIRTYFSTSETLPIEMLAECIVSVDFDKSYTYKVGDLAREALTDSNSNIVGYKFTIKNPTNSWDYADTFLFVVYDYEAVNNKYNAGSNAKFHINSNGIYMGETLVDYQVGDGMATNYSIVRSLEVPSFTVLEGEYKYLDLANNPIIKELDGKIGDIDTALASI